MSNSSLSSSFAFYCPGCNERFAELADNDQCFRCGGPLMVVDEALLGETLLIRRPVDVAMTSSGCGSQDDHKLVGRQLDVYHFRTLLGQGGMGYVYLAEHESLGRQCALKILSPELSASDADYVRRFHQEGRAAASLIHPNVVTVHSIGESEGFHYLEMEFVPGRSLQKLIQVEGRLRPRRAANLAAAIANGLAAAHRLKVIHRDLKPDNVLLSSTGVPKIADFGLAKRVAGIDDPTNESLAGTPNYMAPELFELQPATPASDVYALGVCLYFMLTGRVPFQATNLRELRHEITSAPLPKLRDEFDDIPLEIAECVSELMAKHPANRPHDGIEAAQLLNAIAGQVPDIETLLKSAFRDLPGVKWYRCEGLYRVEVDLPYGRHQTLFVRTSDHKTGERLLLIYSVCCPAVPEYFEQALKLNSEMLHGGLAIRDVDGISSFVMIDTYPRTTVGAEEVRRSVLEIARRADDVEERLTGEDQN